jgi:hypothetical protein
LAAAFVETAVDLHHLLHLYYILIKE